ncbi:ribonuclease H1 domain-containing protein [Anaerosporobacter faecicola]|uniref:ribonuclease H1 domain-containing protein n=1 Tax=Anaerosporobacter faecicola TaxID=2718714 RepID=UPI001439FBEB|nr:ribonuclease H family protein [Anaerosporobacter faecicola]
MPSKFYAVRKGRKTGVFLTWAECQKQISGFSGAEYKSFPTKEEAIDYVTGEKAVNRPPVAEEDRAIAYVDGSYNVHTKEYSYGAIIRFRGKEQEYSEKGTDASLADMRNVAGEILGARKMMELCVNNQIKELDLYYDYEGIEKWCTGAWQAKKEGTQAYRDAYQKMKQVLHVNFHKVAAHTGVELNERVDRLAKKALGM